MANYIIVLTKEERDNFLKALDFVINALDLKSISVHKAHNIKAKTLPALKDKIENARISSSGY